MLLHALTLLACAPDSLPDREPGERAPLTSTCSELDDTRCLLPWPSNSFTRVDETTATGLRVAVEREAMPVEDDPDFLNLANGFSRVTGVVASFNEAVDPERVSFTDVSASLTPEGPLQVLNAQPDSPRYGERMGFIVDLVDASSLTDDRTLVIGRPQEVLEGNADHVVVMLDTMGVSEAPPRGVLVALGLAAPDTDEEAALFAYHAPTRQLLAESDIDPERVLRVWDFTTRSPDDVVFRTHAMMDALDGAIGDLGVEIDSVVLPSAEALAAIVRGRLTGAPSFLDDDGRLVLDDDGLPTITGEAAIEFRVTLPAGDGEYRVALYGHGTGGDVDDNSFDIQLAEENISKLNLRFDGWTDDSFIRTVTGFSAYMEGSERSTAGLMQSVAGGTVLISALDGVLGEVLAADTIGGEPNPAPGRAPATDDVVWLGGSLGGTLGAVIVAADPRLTTAVLNVPGAGWSHMIPHSLLYDSGVGSIMLESYQGDLIDLQVAMVMGQTSWDDVDGAVWADEALEVGGNFLLQQSMGDPVLPNVGTNILAHGLGAVQFEPVLERLYGLDTTSETVTSGAVLEQFRVPDTGVFDVHGFAARDTIAGDAAFEQFYELLQSYWDGDVRVSHPTICTESGLDGTCDFTEAMAEP